MFTWVLSIMLVTVLIEIAILKLVKGEMIPWHEIIFNLNSGQLILWLVRGMEVALFALFFYHANLHILDGCPKIFVYIFAFIGWDLGFYWMHRMHHKLPLLWSVHSVHHHGEHFSLSLALRNSWYSSLTNLPFIIWLAILGVPVDVFIVVSSIHYSIQFYNHTALIKNSGILDKLMITPLNHRVHHAENSIYRNKNFGGTLIWWDKIFGTFQAPIDNIPMQFGSKMSVHTFNPFWANSGQTLAHSIKKGFAKTPSLHSHFPMSYIAIAGILFFMMTINYVRLENILSFDAKLIYVLWLWLSTIALGASSDGTRRSGIILCALCIFAPIIFYAAGIFGTLNLILTIFICGFGFIAFPVNFKQQEHVHSNTLTLENTQGFEIKND